MKYAIMLLVVLALAACTQPIDNTPDVPDVPEDPMSQLAQGCNPAFADADACTEQYDPVCATFDDGSERTIGNECTACALTEGVVSITDGACENEEPLPTNPIPREPEGELSAPTFTACAEPRPEACTREYRPVCAFVPNNIQCITEPCPSFDAQTYGNACDACSDVLVDGHYQGACEDIRFVVCQDTVTGFSAEEYANNVGGVCVDICPGNFDSFTTQIGVEVCIARYGLEEIESWPVCTESSDSCTCARASVTTQGDEIQDSEYRCVPDIYAERMLFYSGLDSLDEDGDQSVMIA